MKATKKLVGASVALAAALAVSVGTTYAWFTQQNYVEVSTIEAQVVKADTDLQVRQVDNKGSGISGKENFTYSLTLDTDYVYGYGKDLKPLTSEDNGVTLQDRDGNEVDDVAEDGGYIELYLEFRSHEALNVVLLNDASIATSTVTSVQNSDMLGGIKAWKEGITEAAYGTTTQKGDVLSTNAANASRVGFYKATPDAKYENAMTQTAIGVWAPHEDGSTAPAGYYKGNLAKEYEESLTGEDATADYTDPNYTAYTLASTATEGGTIVTLTEEDDGAYYAYVCIKIWVEGTDGDCFNYIMGDKFEVKLSFKGNAVSSTAGSQGTEQGQGG